jgi:hypothetical protein
LFQFNLLAAADGSQSVSVFIPGKGFMTTDNKHPMFPTIVREVQDGSIDPDALADLFNVEAGVNRALDDANLSSRVAVVGGTLHLDDEPLSDALAQHILKLLSEQSGDLTGWVRFLERIDANPNEHSRKALFSWLDSLGRNDDGITIDTKTGFLVGYKGVRRNSDDSLVSVNAGPAIVDGREHTSGPVPNAVGSVIEMKRSDVEHNPAIGCSRGLHVGTWAYASGWAQGAVLEVHVDPADVVSVPTDCDAQKMRCSKYEVVAVLDAPYNSATLDYDGGDSDNDAFRWDDDDDDIPSCKSCGDADDVEWDDLMDDWYCAHCDEFLLDQH